MLSGPCLNAAARSDWNTVFFLLNIKSVVDIHARHLEHPEGFRLLDYAQEQNKSAAILRLQQLGAVPSYDIKLFKAAADGAWDDVYELLHLYNININLRNTVHPEGWTLLDYAIAQDKMDVIHDLVINKEGKDAQTLNTFFITFTQEIQQQASSIHQPLPISAHLNPYYKSTLNAIKPVNTHPTSRAIFNFNFRKPGHR